MPSIFSFGDFISAFALLVIVYMITDIRYRFRISVSPIPLYTGTFVLIALIGFGTLACNYIFSGIWDMSAYKFWDVNVQLALGAFFLLLALVWIYVAFISPPKFSKWNYRRYHDCLYRIILNGTEDDLKVIANEVGRSANAIINLAGYNRKPEDEGKEAPCVHDYAKSVISLIGNKKFCRNVILFSPNTAMAFFDDMAREEAFDVPIRQFSTNLSTEAIANKDSILYHEDEGYYSGLLGYQKPFTRLIYGNYKLVESLAQFNGSPMDVDYKLSTKWDSEQLEVYCRVSLILIEDYLNSVEWGVHSYAIYRALDKIHSSCRDLYRYDGTDFNYDEDVNLRLHAVVGFIGKAIDLLDKSGVHQTKLKPDNRFHGDLYDHLANMMFEIVKYAGSVGQPRMTSWFVQHNTVWTSFFKRMDDSKTGKIVRYKLRRLIYDEIVQKDTLPHFGSARVLGLCLNVMGLRVIKNDAISRDDYPLHKAVIHWVENNYINLVEKRPEVAEACLLGSISFDKENSRLVKTYEKGLDKEAPQEFLNLK